MSNLEANCPLDIDAIHARLVALGPPCWRDQTRERAAIAAIVADPAAGLAALAEGDCRWVLARLLGREERAVWARGCAERASAYAVAAAAYAASHAAYAASANANAAAAAVAAVAAAARSAARSAARAADAAAYVGGGAELRAQVSQALELLGWRV